jgi:hypothetical protein
MRHYAALSVAALEKAGWGVMWWSVTGVNIVTVLFVFWQSPVVLLTESVDTPDLSTPVAQVCHDLR